MRVPPLPAAAAAVLLAGLLLAFGPATLREAVLEPLQAQADPARGLETGYSVVSLAFWTLLALPLAYAAYALVFERWGLRPDAPFFLALVPLLVFGPLYHALLRAGALPLGTAWAYAAAEPLVYITTAALALAGLALGRLARAPLEGLRFVGLLAAAAALVRAVDVAATADMARGGGLLLLALASAALLAPVGRRLAPRVGLGASFAVLFAHALDGATTWLSLRDPFGWGFEGFRESNPLSERLVMLSNGWPYFALKLALPLVVLALVRSDEGEDQGMIAFLLFAVFVLGYGPGMSNLLQVVLG